MTHVKCFYFTWDISYRSWIDHLFSGNWRPSTTGIFLEAQITRLFRICRTCYQLPLVSLGESVWSARRLRYIKIPRHDATGIFILKKWDYVLPLEIFSPELQDYLGIIFRQCFNACNKCMWEWLLGCRWRKWCYISLWGKDIEDADHAGFKNVWFRNTLWITNSCYWFGSSIRG